jgi:hypothetical protein
MRSNFLVYEFLLKQIEVPSLRESSNGFSTEADYGLLLDFAVLPDALLLFFTGVVFGFWQTGFREFFSS